MSAGISLEFFQENIHLCINLRYVCVTCPKCKTGDFFNCERQTEYCGKWEHFEFEESWSAKARHNKEHLVQYAGHSAGKDPTLKEIHAYLVKKFPYKNIAPFTRRSTALDMWQHYSQRFS